MAKLIVADIAPQSYTPHHGPIFDALLETTPSDAKSREEVQQFLSLNFLTSLPLFHFNEGSAQRKRGRLQLEI